MKKWWGTHLQALWIWSSPEKGSKRVWKEANLIILLWWMQKMGQMKRMRMRMREKLLLWLPFLHGQISHQPNNVITQPITVPFTQSSTKVIPKSATRSACLPHTQCPNTTFSANQKRIFQQKACRIHPKFRCHMLTCSYIFASTRMWVQAIGLFAQATCAPEFGLPRPFNQKLLVLYIWWGCRK